ncbi:haloacid dehalogenase superfamily protein, subfamily IB, phosphoserine phosphatase [Sphaerochaeta pleomorpha str. Grapes]|uniref:phosphoserine phosphatase n=1 Tax=Sphaerochaeta pleomorpha (strain ATCC BAA-1885 / DSM 22778 / Grapes) TaxID=158190 RepID=G8QXZ9_SPHPG|nr:HAD-IB family phosphatase [Sphaerochaeta pleomorpha]AEV28504.1 haloacid dehalogenase superfamily protein, subfamily IB, phosphoserine phosphatase [Sphaerochaeta pleomorpha str. Grapes]
MEKDTLIAFDFDGTLYPIDPYDSEQLLMLACSAKKGTLNRKRTKLAVRQDQKGNMDWAAFTASYRLHTKSCNEDLIQSVTKALLGKVHPADFEALRQLSSRSDFAIISCGTENLVEAFLQALGISDLFIGIWGKRLHFSEDRKTSMEIHVKGPQDKARVLDALGKDYARTIAIGDGPTDIPMLQSADLGLIVDWKGKGNSYPFETFSSLDDACRKANLFINGA